MKEKRDRKGAPAPEAHEPPKDNPYNGISADQLNEDGEIRDADADRKAKEPVRRIPAVCICPSCRRTEAQLPTTPCHEMLCPKCRIPMRES